MTELVTGPVFTEDYWRDPHDVLSRLREQAPVREVDLPEGGSTWLVTRYTDVRAAFADERLAKDWRATLPLEQRASAPGLPAPGGDMMILKDPPEHTRLRRLVARTFTVRRIAALRPRIEAIAGALLDDLPTDRPVDLVTAFAVPLPMAVICELLGVPLADRDAFAGWSNTMVDEGPAVAKQQASGSLASYLHELVAAKRAAPDEALVSALVAVEEFLRWGSPVANAPLRFAATDVEIGGVTIPAGATVTLSVAAANRDPQRFDGPDLYDPARDVGGHLAFGHGIHFCLGAALARLEGEVALGALLDRFPRLSSAVPLAELTYRRSVLVHALKALPVRLVP